MRTLPTFAGLQIINSYSQNEITLKLFYIQVEINFSSCAIGKVYWFLSILIANKTTNETLIAYSYIYSSCQYEITLC